MPPDPTDELQPLAQAIDGLLYPSESDTPFDLISWGTAAGLDAREHVLAHCRAQSPITELSLDAFFSPLANTDDAMHFDELREALHATLTGIRVFRVGSIRVEIYLIGQTLSGRWAGIHTTSVET